MNIKRWGTKCAFPLLLLSILLSSCPGNSSDIPVKSVSIPETLSLVSGSSSVLEATITPSKASNKGVGWSSSDTAVATVSNGTVTGVGQGTASITVKTDDGGITDTCTVTVTGIPVTGVSLPASAGVLIGGTTALIATVAPENATNQVLSWITSAPTIATVESGTVTGMSAGTAIITVRTDDGDFSDTCRVTVTATTVAVTGVSLPTKITIPDGASYVLTAIVTPDSATNQTLTWSTSNPAVAEVTNGTVSGMNPGEAVITVRAADGGFTANCTVTVETATTVTNVAMTPTIVSLRKGGIVALTVAIEPASASNKTYTCTSSNSATVEIYDQFSGEIWIRGTGVGTGTVTVSTDDGGKTASCVVTVSDATPTPILPSGVSLLPKTLYLVAGGGSSILTPTVAPANAVDKSVNWSTNLPSVATVSNDGTVTPIAAGTATITATTNVGGFTDTCLVTVTSAPVSVSSVTMPASISIARGGSATLVATVLPVEATNKILDWTSSNTAIATVDNTGNVTGVSAGTATITATSASNGSVTASCVVTVTAPGTVIIIGE